MSFASLSVHDFIQSLASAEPTPGGGTAAAIAGAMGAGLLMMVAGLPRTRGNTDAERATLADLRGQIAPRLWAFEACADRDTAAYQGVMAAYKLPKATDEEKVSRKTAIAAAMRGATEVPLETLRHAVEALELGITVARIGNPSAASDAGVGASLLGAAAEGAAANVRINLSGVDDVYRREASDALDALLARARASQAAIREAIG